MGPALRCRVRVESGCGQRPKSSIGAHPDLRRDLGIARQLGRTLEEFYDLPDAERERQIEAWHLEKDHCPVHGGSFEECPDEQRDWYPQRRYCWPAAELAVAERMFDHLHEDAPWHDGSFRIWQKEFSPATPWHYRDGMTLYLSEVDENPDDHFLTDKFASPLRSVAQESPGDER